MKYKAASIFLIAIALFDIFIGVLLIGADNEPLYGTLCIATGVLLVSFTAAERRINAEILRKRQGSGEGRSEA